MADSMTIAKLELQIGARRERAAATRRRAGEVDDALANHSLLQRADELDREAEEFEIQLSVLLEDEQLVDAETDPDPSAQDAAHSEIVPR